MQDGTTWRLRRGERTWDSVSDLSDRTGDGSIHLGKKCWIRNSFDEGFGPWGLEAWSLRGSLSHRGRQILSSIENVVRCSLMPYNIVIKMFKKKDNWLLLLFSSLRASLRFQEKCVPRAEQGGRWKHFNHCPRRRRGVVRCPSWEVHSVHPPAERLCEKGFGPRVSGASLRHRSVSTKESSSFCSPPPVDLPIRADVDCSWRMGSTFPHLNAMVASN